jgi:NitT/TauT family transport system ATP-binding protein
MSESEKTAVEILAVSAQFADHAVLRDINLKFKEGEFVALVGPTGCGKSTLLNLVAGLLAPMHGEVRAFDKTVSGPDSHTGYLFQQDALFPWKTALDNVAAGLVFRGTPIAEARRQAAHWLAKVGLRGFESHFPHQLSGGMKKRASLAQVLILSPRILLMDEPFSALDVQTRNLMENELLRLWQEDRKLVLFVTHDLEEAIALADRVVVLSAGPASRPVGQFSITIERPRDVSEIRLTPAFLDHYREIWSVLRREVLRSYEGRQ